MLHQRFKRKVWVFKKDFTGSLAKWLVKQSPYIVPDNLENAIIDFHSKLDEIADFDELEMAEVDLSDLTSKIDSILWSIPSIACLNQAKDPTTPDIIFVSRYNGPPENPDRDFIDITAVAQNITCDFAQRMESKEYLENINKSKKGDPS